MEFLFYLFFLLKLINANHPLYICGTTHAYKTIHLLPNEIGFFESYNFPNVAGYLHHSKTVWCETNFTIDTSSKNKRIVILITNPLSLQFLTINDGNDFYFWEPNLIFLGGIITRYAFQGFALHDEGNDDDSCFLQSISTVNNPFEFEDESQILYIRSTYFSTTFRKKSCEWKFIAPDGFGFKIVIREMHIIDDTIITATNKTNYYIFDTFTARLNQTYYNGDNSLTIYLSKNSSHFLPVFEFGAYISIIKNRFHFIDANCTIKTEEGLTKWTNINSLNPNGYANNAHCFYNLSVPTNTLIYVTSAYELAVEENVDAVKYYDENEEMYLIFDEDLYFLPYTNGKERQILWKFESDGSVRNAGFILDFLTIYCFCAKPIWIVPCDSPLYTHITNTSLGFVTYTDAYCGNMKCNFTIQMDASCSHKFLSFMAHNDKSVLGVSDNLRLISDNKTVMYMNYANRDTGEFRALLHSNSTTIFEVSTSDISTLSPRKLSITIETFEITNFIPTIKLTKEKSYYLVDLNVLSVGTYFNVEIEDILEFEDVSIEIYNYETEAHSSLIFYTNEKLEKVIQYDDCFKADSNYCKTNVKKLTVYYVFVQVDYIFFQIAFNDVIDNCLLHPNVMFLNIDDPISTFSAIAGPQRSCKVFIFLGDFMIGAGYAFPKIWTTSENNDVKVYIGMDEEILLFKFNKKTMNQWQNIPLSVVFYTIEIPTNSSIIIFFDQILFNPILTTSYKSVIYSPFFSTLYDQQHWDIYLFLNVSVDNKNFVSFHLTYYNISPNMSIQFHSNNGIQNISDITPNLNFTNTAITALFFSPSDTVFLNFPGVIIEMDVNMDKEIETPNPVTKKGTTQIIQSTTRVIKNIAVKTNYHFYIIMFLCIFF